MEQGRCRSLPVKKTFCVLDVVVSLLPEKTMAGKLNNVAIVL